MILSHRNEQNKKLQKKKTKNLFCFHGNVFALFCCFVIFRSGDHIGGRCQNNCIHKCQYELFISKKKKKSNKITTNQCEEAENNIETKTEKINVVMLYCLTVVCNGNA